MPKIVKWDGVGGKLAIRIRRARCTAAFSVVIFNSAGEMLCAAATL
jgi:isopentenyldiphosphate isomerase